MLGKKPQRVRPWYSKHGVQADAREVEDKSWVVEAVRNFTYTKDGGATEVWEKQVRVAPESVVRVWYLLEPFTNSPAIAHPYFIFEYHDGKCVCFTIEGKRLDGEAYSGWKGLMNEYELGYVWITLSDCLTMPLTHEAKSLFLYPLTLTPEKAGALCRAFLSETHALYKKPEFYNTVLNNCTGRFAKTLRTIGIRAPHDVSWYLPGYSDSYLQKLGLIAPSTKLRDPSKDLMKRKDEVWRYIEQLGVARIEILG